VRKAGIAVLQLLGAELVDLRLERCFVGAEPVGLGAVMLVDHFFDRDGAGHRRLRPQQRGGCAEREAGGVP
jgi:hypothetical protein